MTAVYFSPEHNAAAVVAPSSTADFNALINGINYALEVLYGSPDDLGPFLYEAWNGEAFQGIVVSEPFGATEDARILLEFDRIVNSNREAPEFGDYAPKEFIV